MKNLYQILQGSARQSDQQPGSMLLSVVIIYIELYEALRAADALELIRRNHTEKIHLHLTLVPVAELCIPERFEEKLSSLTSVNLIIVSADDAKDFSVSLKRWMKSCIDRKCSPDTSMLALLGSPERSDHRLNPEESNNFHYLKFLAERSSLNFIAPRRDAEMETICI